MAIADALVSEFDHEMAVTRTVLERVPFDNPTWAPHEKSMTLKRLATHVATLPNWAMHTMGVSEFDLGADGYKPPDLKSADELVAEFDKHVADARAALASASDADFMAPWTFRNGETVFFTMPKASVIRSFMMNHSIHHRGQLTVYLRLLDVPLPSVYGPTADTQI
ncbi:MAG TPA: DinB family protein [Candidatus Kapabacteria bacterium]|nr:DinB family protein [Candidatus Kapabacteria bacterium]